MKKFPLCTLPAPLVGRKKTIDRMVNNLTKQTPQHLSLVAPRYFGKSVLLAELSKKIRASESFECVIEWDLGHQTPQNDKEFVGALSKKIGEGLKQVGNEFADFLDDDSGYDELRELIRALGKEGTRILMVWDGFDHPMRAGKLTRNLWDNLLELCRQDAFVLVTASRSKLRELIRDEQSVTSEFWLVFEMVPMGPLNESDLQAFANEMVGYSLENSALKELGNWSGGIPPLLVWLLNRLLDSSPAGKLTNDEVNSAANEGDDVLGGIMDTLWCDVPSGARDLFQFVSENASTDYATAGKVERACLLEYGLANQSGTDLKVACRFLGQHVAGFAPAAGTLGRLFSTPEAYESNIRGILERRLAQIPEFDEMLFHMIRQRIGDIPTYPGLCLSNLTNVEEKALDLIWARELDEHRELPSQAVSYWTESPSQNRIVRSIMEAETWEFPSDRAQQLGILQLLTGSDRKFTRSMSKVVSKDTYVLLTAIHSLRNRSQHASGQEVPLGVAVSAMMLCVELLHCLSVELS